MIPTEYGKVIEQFDNKYIVQLNTSNIVIIKELDNENYIKFFRKGEFMFEFKDTKISDNIFSRTISDNKFTFKDNKLISTEILTTVSWIKIYDDTDAIILKNSNPIYKDSVNSDKTYLENTYIFKNYPAASFISFKLSLIFLLYIILFVIFPESNENMAMAVLSGKNIIKLRKIGSRNVWETIILNFYNRVFTKSLFESKVNEFWNQIQDQFNNKNHMFLLIKIKYINNDFVTIGKLIRLNHYDKKWFIDFIIESMKFKSEYYNETQIESLIFSYGFKDGKIANKEEINLDINSIVHNELKLPISLNPMDYGKFLKTITIENGKLFVVQNSKGQIIMFSKFEEFNEIEYLNNGKSLTKFKDEVTSKNTFVRILDNKKYYFENKDQILFTKDIKTKFISKINKSKTLVNNFITLDIETYIKDNILIPFCISIYDGNIKSNFYLTDFKNHEELIISALKSIMIRKYNNYNVYMHNMAKFDIIFLFKYLVKLGDLHPIIHNDRIISIEFNYGKDNEYRIKFKDSYLLLLNSLYKLCNSFSVENRKSIFPHLFVNENNLNYIGEVPDYKYFDDISVDNYNKYKSNFNNNWCLKDEVIKYCNLDCISLFQILFKFNNMIFDLFGKNVHHYPTLPSLAFAIFRSNFMSDENIPQLSGKIAKDIRQGYTGGAVDMYIPESKPNVKINCYDVNSLYPSQMQSQEMPVGVPTYFKGDIRLINPNAFGFFYCEIIAPDNIKHPIIQTHVKTNNGIRTMAPIGSWEDMIFSAEMDNAKKYGYKFNILWGYTFESKVVFKEDVDFLYNLRLKYNKSDPMNFIGKILLNSLYGRFGMDDNFTEAFVIKNDYYHDFENKFLNNILSIEDLGDYKLVIISSDENKIEETEGVHNVSIATAAAITAYARIHMSQFKNNPKINLYYSDTDSIYTDSDLDEYLIDGKILGKLKLEHICKKAIFLTPKVYCLITDSDEFIFKIKGLSHNVKLKYSDFKKLLIKNTFIEQTQEKWFRNLSDAKITLLEQLYTLQVTDNKRQLIYDENNKLINTKSYELKDNEIL
jgi:DNA polymerase type B, organellar and viral